ncbi:hypothetical protein [Corynebacterium terpenotabidum]|uniref:Secreted protein n=1 Tax=Corynebacterium terpenotabidum Y-11 TaxID=1200352 RepID=S4XLG8_9CORY|nr:hypothetical protein [Corynebacterium terpenotabidum]AGP31438.1 hypothetical protein A606_08985 [Corynebacterium terpenotabidum Y-11]
MTTTRIGRVRRGLVAVGLALAVAGPTGTGAAVAQETASATASAPATAAPVTEPETAEPQTDPHEDDLWIPDWVLLLVPVALIVAAVSMATKSYLRFTQTRRELEG